MLVSSGVRECRRALHQNQVQEALQSKAAASTDTEEVWCGVCFLHTFTQALIHLAKVEGWEKRMAPLLSGLSSVMSASCVCARSGGNFLVSCLS